MKMLEFPLKLLYFCGKSTFLLEDRIHTKGTEDHDASANKSLCPENYPTC